MVPPAKSMYKSLKDILVIYDLGKNSIIMKIHTLCHWTFSYMDFLVQLFHLNVAASSMGDHCERAQQLLINLQQSMQSIGVILMLLHSQDRFKDY